MANLRMLKKSIDYTLEGLVFDCNVAMICHPDKQSAIFEVMKSGVDVRNEAFEQVMNPFGKQERAAADKHGKLPRKCPDAANGKLLRRQYAALVDQTSQRFDELFDRLSTLAQ